MSQSESAIDLLGLLIPLHQGFILLPNAAVAEVIGYREAEPVANTPDWILGDIQWRRKAIPLLSFEMANSMAYIEPKHRARICVCNTLKPDTAYPYVGIVARGVPRLVRLNDFNVTEASDTDAIQSALILRAVNVADETAMIPDLDALELLLAEWYERE